MWGTLQFLDVKGHSSTALCVFVCVRVACPLLFVCWRWRRAGTTSSRRSGPWGGRRCAWCPTSTSCRAARFPGPSRSTRSSRRRASARACSSSSGSTSKSRMTPPSSSARRTTPRPRNRDENLTLERD